MAARGWAEAQRSGSTPRNPVQPGAMPGVCAILFCAPHPSSRPPHSPPATAASAWEITDTESAAARSADGGLSASEDSWAGSGLLRIGVGKEDWEEEMDGMGKGKR